MSFFSKIGDGIKNAVKWTGNNLGKVASIAAPIAAIGALAVPVVGGSLSSLISKVAAPAQKIADVAGNGSTMAKSIGGIASGVKPAAVAESAGGLFGKGGFLGTGLFAGAEAQKINAQNRLEAANRKLAEKASEVLGIKITSVEEARQYLSGEKFREIETLAYKETDLSIKNAVASGAPASSVLPSAPGDGSIWVKVGVAALAAKLFGLI